jgi:hypothetical protein
MATWQSKIVYTPPMYASYPFLVDPRNGSGKADGPDKDKSWRLNVVGDQNDPKVKAFLNQIKGFMKEAWGPEVGFKKDSNPIISKNGMPMRPEMVQNDDGEMVKTGRLSMKVTRKLIDGRTKAPQGGPLLVDSSGVKAWPKSLLIGNDSVVSVKLHFWAWDRRSEGEGVGISAELHGVQVIEHIPYEGGGAEINADGFAPVAGGAVAPDAPEDDFQNLPQDDFSQQLRKAAEETEAASAGYTDDEPF